MSARRSSQPSVQLFPFLAVLMCALGALILMLLVTATRIRDQARARVNGSHAAPAVIQPPSVVRHELPPRAEWKPQSMPPAVALQPVPAAQAPTLPVPPAESLRQQWLRTVTDLEAAAAAEEAALRARRAVAEEEEAALSTTTTQLAGLQQDADSLTQRRIAAEAEWQQATQQRADLRRAISAQQTELEQLRQQQQAAGSRFSILPYDGRTGTVRRPIYVECTETGLTFASEGITLTPEQLNGFPPLQNPLRAGADALIDYWSLKGLRDAASDELGAPYVLLIVRPRGTVGYYVARRMLESLEQPFGYELVPEDLAMQWPDSDEGAVKACRAAIDAVLQNRDRFVYRGGGAAPGSLQPLSVADGQGRFALEEVERLRGNGRTVHFGGRTFDRNASGAGSTPGFGNAPSRAGNGTHAVRDDGHPTPSPDEGLSARGSRGEAGPGTSSPAGSPETASRSAADDAATAFSSAAARTGRDSGGQTGTPGSDRVDPAPRPLLSRDALERDNLAPARRTPRNPKETLRDPGSQIGLERKVIVRVEPQRVIVETEPDITISSGMSREELQDQLAQSLHALFVSWGHPPRGFYWAPQVKYSVLPGGHQHVKRLTDLTGEWEIASEIDFALD